MFLVYCCLFMYGIYYSVEFSFVIIVSLIMCLISLFWFLWNVRLLLFYKLLSNWLDNKLELFNFLNCFRLCLLFLLMFLKVLVNYCILRIIFFKFFWNKIIFVLWKYIRIVINLLLLFISWLFIFLRFLRIFEMLYILKDFFFIFNIDLILV